MDADNTAGMLCYAIISFLLQLKLFLLLHYLCLLPLLLLPTNLHSTVFSLSPSYPFSLSRIYYLSLSFILYLLRLLSLTHTHSQYLPIDILPYFIYLFPSRNVFKQSTYLLVEHLIRDPELQFQYQIMSSANSSAVFAPNTPSSTSLVTVTYVQHVLHLFFIFVLVLLSKYSTCMYQMIIFPD